MNAAQLLFASQEDYVDMEWLPEYAFVFPVSSGISVTG